MRTAIWALIVVISIVMHYAEADSHHHKKAPKTKNAVLNPHPGPGGTKRHRHLGKPLLKRPSQFRFSRLYPKFAPPLPLAARHARKIKVKPVKKVPPPNSKTRRVTKKKPIVRKVSDFARFLRAFGRQIGQPIQSRFPASVVNNRRKFKINKGKVHPLVFTKAENIDGYEKFTLDDVVYPEDKLLVDKAEKRSDNDESETEIVEIKIGLEESEKKPEKSENPFLDSTDLAKKVDVR